MARYFSDVASEIYCKDDRLGYIRTYDNFDIRFEQKATGKPFINYPNPIGEITDFKAIKNNDNEIICFINVNLLKELAQEAEKHYLDLWEPDDKEADMEEEYIPNHNEVEGL